METMIQINRALDNVNKIMETVADRTLRVTVFAIIVKMMMLVCLIPLMIITMPLLYVIWKWDKLLLSVLMSDFLEAVVMLAKQIN